MEVEHFAVEEDSISVGFEGSREARENAACYVAESAVDQNLAVMAVHPTVAVAAEADPIGFGGVPIVGSKERIVVEDMERLCIEIVDRDSFGEELGPGSLAGYARMTAGLCIP